jgi:phosphatidylglycerophosphatase A
MLATFVFTLAAIFIAQFYEDLVGQHDLPEVVVDEVVGLLVTMTWIPLSWPFALCGFAVFRAFDILKPFPISYVDRNMRGGIGCVGDDLIAGILSNIVLQIILQRGWL